MLVCCIDKQDHILEIYIQVVFTRTCPVQWHVASGGDEAVDRGGVV